MNQREQNIISTLNMLVALHRQQQIFKNVWTPKQLNTLQVTKEHISDARLSVPTFLNALDELAKKGYLINNSIISQQQRNQLDDVQAGNYKSEIVDYLSKVDTPEKQEQLKIGIANFLKNTIPKDCEFDEEELMATKITVEDLMNCGLQYITDTTDLVAVVILMPFRSTYRLLSKMNTGMSFDDVKDPGLWYNPDSFTLYCDDKEYSTKYRNDPTLVHFIFESLFKQPNETLDYSHVETGKTIRACFDSLLHFIKKYPELDLVFSITKGSIEIKSEYLNDVH